MGIRITKTNSSIPILLLFANLSRLKIPFIPIMMSINGINPERYTTPFPFLIGLIIYWIMEYESCGSLCVSNTPIKIKPKYLSNLLLSLLTESSPSHDIINYMVLES